LKFKANVVRDITAALASSLLLLRFGTTRRVGADFRVDRLGEP
jgi:hypothetical protein